MRHLIANPPKYEIDGDIQVWRGLPKLPDVLDTMMDFREARAEETRRRQDAAEERRLRKIAIEEAKHPENFIGMAELQEICRKALKLE